MFISILFLTSCKEQDEEEVYTTNVLSATTTYNSVSINAEFELQGNTNYVYGGICWGEEPMPDMDDNVIENQYLTSELSQFNLNYLYSNHTYYVRSYFLFTPSDIQYSNNFSFTTSPLPDPPCAVTNGTIDFGPFNQTMTPLVATQEFFYVNYKTECSIGDLEFRFKEIPKSGIYHIRSGFSDLEDFEVYVHGHLQGAWSCFYGCGDDGADVYVINDGQGSISFSFCELGISTSGGCAAAYYIMLGKVSN